MKWAPLILIALNILYLWDVNDSITSLKSSHEELFSQSQKTIKAQSELITKLNKSLYDSHELVIRLREPCPKEQTLEDKLEKYKIDWNLGDSQ